MKIKISKAQWEGIGKKAEWIKIAQNSSEQMSDMIRRLNQMQSDFRHVSANLPKEKWDLIGSDCDAVSQYLENAAGRISTIIHKTKV